MVRVCFKGVFSFGLEEVDLGYFGRRDFILEVVRWIVGSLVCRCWVGRVFFDSLI